MLSGNVQEHDERLEKRLGLIALILRNVNSILGESMSFGCLLSVDELGNPIGMWGLDHVILGAVSSRIRTQPDHYWHARAFKTHMV
jgi:hypothetical protein